MLSSRTLAIAGLATALVAGGVALAPHAVADEAACITWNGVLTAVEATGPGEVTVTVEAQVQTTDDTQPCFAEPSLAGYTAKRLPPGWSAGTQTGVASLPTSWRTGDLATQQLRLAVGTQKVCVRVTGEGGLDCYDVTVAAAPDGTAATPVVKGATSRPQPKPNTTDPQPSCGFC